MIEQSLFDAFNNYCISQGVPASGISSYSLNSSGIVTSLVVIGASSQAQINTLTSNFNWTGPDPISSFENSVWIDTNIPTSSKVEIIKYFSYFEKNINNPTLLQAVWSDLKTTYSSTWLTNSVSTIVESYMSIYSIPLIVLSVKNLS